MGQDAIDAQQELISALAAEWQQAGLEVSLFETHISRVLLAGPYAYKFKKPVRFSFLDFTSLSMRYHYCEEECRLGRRLAPELYLGVIAFTGTARHPIDDGAGAAIEFAVKMRRFPQDALWSARIQEGRLAREDIDALAERVARFHQDAEAATQDMPWGTSAMVFGISDSTFKELQGLLDNEASQGTLEALQRWETAARNRLGGRIDRRKLEGRVRECHGDLHCANILTLDGQVQAFDCIEFSGAMRWIDVLNDIAFTCMDLGFRGEIGLANRLLSQYLEFTGDYDGLDVFRYFQVHRAMVRCKVALLGATQKDEEARAIDTAVATRYLDFALDCSREHPKGLIITHGFSGCGKSTFAGAMVERGGAIRLRSDVERKRLHGGSATGKDALYGAVATRRTYERLHGLARRILAEAGLPVIVDATFLKIGQRNMFSALAEELGVPFLIVDIRASESAMRKRLDTRARLQRDASDADGAVLSRQLDTAEPLQGEELRKVFTVDMDEALNPEQLFSVSDSAIRALFRGQGA